jgi:hypothetical protein
MRKQFGKNSPQDEGLVTRRTVLGGMVTVALASTMVVESESAQADRPSDLSDPIMSPVGIPMPRGFHTITALHDGRLLVVGGIGPSNRSLSSVLIFDPSRGTWKEAGSLNMARYQHAALLLADGRVMVTGGLNRPGIAIHTVEIYSSSDNSWSLGPPLEMARYGHAMSAMHGKKVLVAGGFLSGPLASIEIYAADGGD